MLKILLLDSILTLLSPAHSLISSLFSPQSEGQNCLCHLPLKFWTLHVFHMIWVRVSLIFKTSNQNSDIYNGNTFVFLCMRITFLDIIQMTFVSEMVKIQFCIVLLATQVSKYPTLTFACPCVIINSHISRICYPLFFCHNNGIISN